MFNFFTNPGVQPVLNNSKIERHHHHHHNNSNHNNNNNNINRSKSDSNAIYQKKSKKSSYSKNMWDSNGVRAISNRIEESKKAMKCMHHFFQDYSKIAFNTSQTMSKLSTANCSEYEIGTLKDSLNHFTQFIEATAKNEDAMSDQIRINCEGKLAEQMKKLEKTSNRILVDLEGWHKQMLKETKQMNKGQENYEEKKKQVLAVEQALQAEDQRLKNYIEKEMISKIPQVQNNIIALQNKLTGLRDQSQKALEQYMAAVSQYRSFRLQFDNSTSVLLNQLEHIEVKRAKRFHKLLRNYLEIQHVMASQWLQNIETAKTRIANIDPYSDNILFIEKYRSQSRKPPMPDPNILEDDRETTPQPLTRELSESNPGVYQWCIQWRLVINKIISKDGDISNNRHIRARTSISSNISIATDSTTTTTATLPDILSDEEFESIKKQCLESLNSPEGRMGFALSLNRLRNFDRGLELGKTGFFELVEVVKQFCDSVERNTPFDVQAAKLVMIMTQSLYIRTHHVLEILTPSEKQDISFNFNTIDTDISLTINTDVNSNTKEKKIGQEEKKEENKIIPRRNKLFLVDRIKNHKLWKMESFWKEAFKDSLEQEFSKYPVTQKWHSPQEQEEAERRNKEIIFSQLAAITHNMKEFGMENNTIINFLEDQKLTPEKKAMLKATLGVFEKITPIIPLSQTGHANAPESDEWDTIDTISNPQKSRSFDNTSVNLDQLETMTNQSSEDNSHTQLGSEQM